MNDIEWISSSNIELNPHNLSVPDRVRRYGYAIVMDLLGSGKAEAAELCILDVLFDHETPRIGLFCPENLIQSWYAALYHDIGVEFKYFNQNECSMQTYSPDIASLYLISNEQLAQNVENCTINKMREDGALWDLVIIDASFSAEGVDTELYINNIINKTERMLIFAPVPSRYDGTCEGLLELVKKKLYRQEQVGMAEGFKVTPEVFTAKADSPVLGNYIAGGGKVVTLEYDIDPQIASPSKRLDDARTQSLVYKCGGNIFEEFSLDERRVYLRSEYNEDMVRTLKTVDQKLALFLRELETVAANPENRIVIYCTAQQTLDYLYKVLKVYYPRELLHTVSKAMDMSRVRSRFMAEEDPCPRIVLAGDTIGSRLICVERVTHVFNYEYPDSPILLESRFYRRGRRIDTPPVFYLFSDKAYAFDGRVLRKVVLANLYRYFRREVPAKSILFSMEGIAEHITALLVDLKYIHDYTGEVGSSFDEVNRFRQEYNIPESPKLTSPSRTHEYTAGMLEALYRMFGVREYLGVREVNREELHAAVSAKVQELTGRPAYYDEEMCLVPAEASPADGENVSDTPDIAGNRFVLGRNSARARLGELTTCPCGYPYLKNELEGLTDIMKMSVLFCTWRYYKTERGVKKSYAEFIALYNKGVI